MPRNSDNKARNRAQFPFATAVVDELRELFGEDTRVTWARESGQEIGTRGPDGVVPVFQSRKEKK